MTWLQCLDCRAYFPLSRVRAMRLYRNGKGESIYVLDTGEDHHHAISERKAESIVFRTETINVIPAQPGYKGVVFWGDGKVDEFPVVAWEIRELEDTGTLQRLLPITDNDFFNSYDEFGPNDSLYAYSRPDGTVQNLSGETYDFNSLGEWVEHCRAHLSARKAAIKALKKKAPTSANS